MIGSSSLQTLIIWCVEHLRDESHSRLSQCPFDPEFSQLAYPGPWHRATDGDQCCSHRSLLQLSWTMIDTCHTCVNQQHKGHWPRKLSFINCPRNASENNDASAGCREKFMKTSISTGRRKQRAIWKHKTTRARICSKMNVVVDYLIKWSTLEPSARDVKISTGLEIFIHAVQFANRCMSAKRSERESCHSESTSPRK